MRKKDRIIDIEESPSLRSSSLFGPLCLRVSVAIFIPIIFITFYSVDCLSQTISVLPSDVNAYSQGATSVLLTFGGLVNKRVAEATWCGTLIPATPDLGLKCDPSTIFGRLPARYDQSTFSGNRAFTDIMSVTPQVARRAYLDAVRGNTSTFFYVRRFTSTVGARDEYVPVIIRLSGNGARVPLSLTEVKLTWGVGKPILFVQTTEKLPRFQAEITYTGTGRLQGRWELVKPGEAPPEPRDLLTEAALPIEERGTQKRYTEISRFNIYLPPTGKIILPGPEVWRVDESLNGLYLVLLRIEASDDKEGDTNFATVGAGAGVVHGGAVAGFSLPVLKYYVGNQTAPPPAITKSNSIAPLLPEDKAIVPIDKILEFSWSRIEGATVYRLEVEDLIGHAILSAVLSRDSGSYRAPSWLKEKIGSAALKWRVTAYDDSGRLIDQTE